MVKDYSKGKQYKIISNNPNFNKKHTYYGSTTQTLSLRMTVHRSDYKTRKGSCASVLLFDMYGIETCIIVLIELYPCSCVEELVAREAHYIQSNPCINKNTPTGLTHKNNPNYDKEYNILRKVKIKLYRETHKEEMKEYYQKNKEEISTKHKEWYENNKTEHSINMKEYYQKNKEEISTKQKEYREKNRKDIIEKARMKRAEKKAEKLAKK
jgi:hypothetical protein